jgi:hypothetical protein
MSEEAIDQLIECARLLGATQAKKVDGTYDQQDSRFETVMYESIAKHRKALEEALATPPAAPAAQRQPLTDEQRRKLMSEAWNKWLSRKDDGRLFAWDFSFEVEAAHGIKENT